MRAVVSRPSHKSLQCSAVEVSEHFIVEDSRGDLRGVNKVEFEARLQVDLLRLVVLQSIEQERRRELNHALRHEDIDRPFIVDERGILIVRELCGKLGTFFRVDGHDMLQQGNIIRLVADLRIEDDLVCLASRRNFAGDACTHVDAQSQRQRRV